MVVHGRLVDCELLNGGQIELEVLVFESFVDTREWKLTAGCVNIC